MTNEVQSLRKALSKDKEFSRFMVWLVGDTPLIVHAWSEKAKREMLGKQIKAVKQGREVRDPQSDFQSSLYEIGDGCGRDGDLSSIVGRYRRHGHSRFCESHIL